MEPERQPRPAERESDGTSASRLTRGPPDLITTTWGVQFGVPAPAFPALLAAASFLTGTASFPSPAGPSSPRRKVSVLNRSRLFPVRQVWGFRTSGCPAPRSRPDRPRRETGQRLQSHGTHGVNALTPTCCLLDAPILAKLTIKCYVGEKKSQYRACVQSSRPGRGPGEMRRPRVPCFRGALGTCPPGSGQAHGEGAPWRCSRSA